MIKLILNNSILLLIGNSIGRLSVFVSNIIAARLMPLDTFGQYSMIRSTISMIDAIVGASLGNIALREISHVHSQQREASFKIIIAVLLMNTVVSILLSIILFIFARPIVYSFFLSKEVMITGLYFGTLLLLVTLLSSAIQKIMIATENYKGVVGISTLNTLASIPVIYFLTARFGLYGGLLGVTFYFTIDFALKLKYVIADLKVDMIAIRAIDVYEQFKNIIIGSRVLFLSSVISAFCYWYIRVLAINKQNNFTDIAMFDAAYQWLTIIMLITGATTSVGLQMMSKDKHLHGWKTFKVNLTINLVIAVVLSVFFSLFSKNIMSLYGNSFISHHFLIYGLGLIATLATVSSVLDKLLIVNQAQNFIVITKVISAVAGITFMKLTLLSDMASQMMLCYILCYFTEVLLYTVTVLKNNDFFFINSTR